MKELIDKYISQEIQDKVSEKKDVIITVLIIIGAVVLCAAIAYIVYRVITKNMEDDALEIEDIDEDEDFFESEED